MENMYNRVDNLDDLIGSVKLPYMTWKVLFLVDKKAGSNELAGLLETEENEIKSSLEILEKNGLIVAEEQAEKPEKADPPKEAAQKEDVALQEPEVAVNQEELDEDFSASVEELQEDLTEEEDIEDEKTLTEEQEKVEKTEAPKEDVVEKVAEEKDSTSTVDAALEEDEEIELLQDTEEELTETVTDSEEDEKIEINIPEGEDEDVDDSEFNFNLTGEEAGAATKAEPTSEPPAEPAKEVDTSGFKKILVIDDSLVIRKMVEIALEEEDFNISTAVSGKEGLDIMDKTNPDLVILDMMLPDINGIEILKTIKASKGIPVIMLSGKDSPQMIETAKNEGAEEFLPKPFKDDDLVEKIKKLI